MNWVEWGKYAIRAEGFSICKAKVNDKWIYTAFKLPNTILGHYRKPEDAKSAIMEIIKSQPSEPDDLFSQPRFQPAMGSGYKEK